MANFWTHASRAWPHSDATFCAANFTEIHPCLIVAEVCLLMFAQSVLFFILFVSSPRPPMLQPQGTSLGAIRGAIADATGAAIEHATVEITDLDTAAVRKTVTDSE